jgi:hypothetical protein
MLLDRTIETIGADRLGETLGLSGNDILRIASDGKPMSLAHQRLLAVAVLSIGDSPAKLRRRAAALLGQVAAAEEFAAGRTETHVERPHAPFR